MSLRGAGYDRTTLDVGGGAVGVSIKGGKGSRVEDLTVRTTGGVALSATATNDLKIRRVRLLGGALGLQLRDVEGGRVENAIIAGAMVGALLSRVRDAALVNCTIASASSIGLSLADVEDAAVFNNLIAEAGTGVMLGGARRGLHLDYNLYRALYAGKVEGQIARVSIGPWRDATGGLDAHSVNLEVRFAGAEAGDFRPVSGMDWPVAGHDRRLGRGRPRRLQGADGRHRRRPTPRPRRCRRLRGRSPQRRPRTARSRSPTTRGPRAPAFSGRTARWSVICSTTCR